MLLLLWILVEALTAKQGVVFNGYKVKKGGREGQRERSEREAQAMAAASGLLTILVVSTLGRRWLCVWGSGAEDVYVAAGSCRS